MVLRRVVVDEEPVLDVLAGVGEVEAEHLDRAAGAVVRRGDVVADHVAAEGDGDVLERGVPADHGALGASGGRRRRPSPGSSRRSAGRRRRRRTRRCRRTSPSPGTAPRPWPRRGRRAVTSSWPAIAWSPPWPVTVTTTGSASAVSAGTSTVKTRRRGVPDPGADPVGRARSRTGRAPSRATGTRSAVTPPGSLDLDVEAVAGERRVVVQALQPLERREPPDLLAPGRDRVVGQVEGTHRVEVGGDIQAHQPTAPSICSSISRLSSRAYSIGSSLAIGSMKPRTIIAIASSCSMPRDMR